MGRYLAATLGVLLACALSSPVLANPINLIQNGSFQSGTVADWNGTWPALLLNWPSIPSGNAALATDLYQSVATVPGQTYLITFDAVADLYFAPSVTIGLALNNQTVTTFTTPSYTYNPSVNRYDQMHWEELTYSFTASASTTRVEFIDENTYDFGLTEVSMVAVPDRLDSFACLAACISLLFGLVKIRSRLTKVGTSVGA